MIGKWQGKYGYITKLAPIPKNTEVTFTIVIDNFDGENFSGKITDDMGEYSTRGEGKVVGKIENGSIEFIKRMPILTAITASGKIKEYKAKEHSPIFYSGELNSENSFTGIWKSKPGIRMNGFKSLLISFGMKGSWEMKKLE